nr:uncharacterized protein LOC107434516 isoform X2 [Ziziphus jujuba var. spinosa]
MNSVEDLHKVWETKALKKPGEDKAKKLLDRIAKQVQPIMRKHKWRVKLLSEFCHPALLGQNAGRGAHVQLRLRRPNRDSDFLPFDQILDTMLHELCHNVHGPHNASFYNLWDELRKECEELIAKGITGTGYGFDLPGRRLGGFSRQPSISSLRTTALAAAEKRAKLGSLLPSGPKRLGGDSTIMVGLSPIQAAAMAAERRLQDDIWCGSASCEASEDGEGSPDKLPDIRRTEQGAESIYMQDPNMRSKGKSRVSENSSSKSNCHPESTFMSLSGPSSSKSTSNCDTHYTIETAQWECEVCTLLNPPLAPLCKLCSTLKPINIGSKHKIWSCKFCTLENSGMLDKCSACDQWRYSHGPPVAFKAPNLGT